MTKISVYAINLPHRHDRYKHILEQFKDKPEFSLNVVPAIVHEIGAYGLWQTVQQIVRKEVDNTDNDFFILCEDDHEFTKSYSYEILVDCIRKAHNLGADILSGGFSWFNNAVQVGENLFWVDKFNGLQFTIIFKKLYSSILTVNFNKSIITDLFLSNLSENKFVVFPYISIQKEFGYSDVTSNNNKIGYVSDIFKMSFDRFSILDKVSNFYKSNNPPKLVNEYNLNSFNEIKVPTYVINMKGRNDRLEHTLEQFRDKPEFNVNIIEACIHPIGRVGLWKSIVKIINIALKDNDDIVIICEDDHTFTKDYERDLFFKNIIDAASQHVEILIGGIGGFGSAVPITLNRYWVDWFWCTQFVVYYRPVFQKILNYKFTDKDTSDGVLSEITSHKNVIYPFISTQVDFGYSDVTLNNDKVRGKITDHFCQANEKMNTFYQANMRYLRGMSDDSTQS